MLSFSVHYNIQTANGLKMWVCCSISIVILQTFLYCDFQDTNSVIYLAELEFLIRVSSKATADLLVSSGQKLKLSWEALTLIQLYKIHPKHWI